MDKVRNPCIASIFMNNVQPKMVELQKQVVAKYNKSKIFHYQVLTEAPPGFTMDKLVDMLEKRGHDAIMFLDIDALPLNENAFDYFFEQVYSGKVIGSAQRSNHIQNNQHVFAAPHNVTFTVELYRKLGNPSFMPNYRGDVAANMMRQGVTMGVSSRGVGSLVKKGDQNEVQDDFELICFDLVSSPSTPGAYLYLNKEDRPRYEEKLSEHDNTLVSVGGGLEKSVDLMKRLSDYLGK